MDVLRLTQLDLRCQNHLECLRPQIQEMHRSIYNNYQRWKASCLSIVTYLFVVATVALYDMRLTIYYSPSLKQMEVNPIGRWMMNLDHVQDGVMPNLTLFLTSKLVGTLIVLATIYLLVLRSSRFGHAVGVGVTCFQLILAGYLTFVTN